MTTTNIKVNSSTWTQLTTQADFTLQNVGSVESATPDVYMMASDSIPVSVSDGVMVEYMSGFTSGMITGTIWGKAVSGTSQIAVSE